MDRGRDAQRTLYLLNHKQDSILEELKFVSRDMKRILRFLYQKPPDSPIKKVWHEIKLLLRIQENQGLGQGVITFDEQGRSDNSSETRSQVDDIRRNPKTSTNSQERLDEELDEDKKGSV